MQVLYDAGYDNIESDVPGETTYSFSGLSGSLDHVLANDAACDDVTGADIWNINSPESIAFEYSRFNNNVTNFHQSNVYRSSDHDPEIVGIKRPDTIEKVQILGTNDFHGRINRNPTGAEAGAAVMAGAVDYFRDLPGYEGTVFAAAGDLIGASTFESFILNDKPTIDALNAAGLDVSAVGNHEFDQGYDDLVNRVMAPYDIDDNPDGRGRVEVPGCQRPVQGHPRPGPRGELDQGLRRRPGRLRRRGDRAPAGAGLPGWHRGHRGHRHRRGHQPRGQRAQGRGCRHRHPAGPRGRGHHGAGLGRPTRRPTSARSSTA